MGWTERTAQSALRTEGGRGRSSRREAPVLRLHGILWLEGRGCVTGRGEAGKAKKDPECHQRFGPRGHRELLSPLREGKGQAQILIWLHRGQWNGTGGQAKMKEEGRDERLETVGGPGGCLALGGDAGKQVP